jgi:hypothetical protein
VTCSATPACTSSTTASRRVEDGTSHASTASSSTTPSPPRRCPTGGSPTCSATATPPCPARSPQLGLDRQGRFWWIADGRCNHNGFGTWGNDSIGIETFANGGGNPREPWNRSQVEAATVATAAILRRLGLPADRVKGHRETDPARKIDPFGVDLDSIRSQVARSLTAPDDQEDPMAALGPPLTVAVCPDPNDPGGPTHMWLVENWGTPIPPKYARLDGDAAARWRNRAERADLAYVDFRPDYQAAWLAGHQRIADIT